MNNKKIKYNLKGLKRTDQFKYPIPNKDLKNISILKANGYWIIK